MARLDRRDGPDTWHHVMNRGCARRAIFERKRDHRYFESRVARAIRRGEIEVHAYSEVSTHFHMLVRSPVGLLSDAMRRIQNEYVRYFNRSNRRDGPLLRGRFRSHRIDSLEYRRMVVRYIDDNAAEACLARDAASYPFGSARSHTSSRGRIWLSRDWIRSECGGAEGDAPLSPETYFARFPTRLPEGFREWIERRVMRDSALFDDLTPLLRADPPSIRAWMQRKARLADGTKPGLPAVPVTVLETSIDRLRRAGLRPEGEAPWCGLGPWPVLRAGLLRDLCALTYNETGLRIARPASTARDRVTRHRAAVLACPRYAEASAIVARAALDCVLES